MQIAKLLLFLIIGSFAVAGCDTNDGPAEEAGESLDNAGDRMKDAADDAGDEIEDACEEAKEGVGADDTDC